ncbi:glycosyltransferase [Roseimicrobium sp. ORNL1]|uniref:glycosyltransferase n=1 Tax=Roseimicrobium sp. ORNL1 TaxID=2711231 RepID=UPI0013E1D8AF|nr:glycosyltransferase [Roseimicrobium sp. ORNL1]QIF04695.1 glycosyltransferase [Roseimicrobium sp. ORNL1]
MSDRNALPSSAAAAEGRWHVEGPWLRDGRGRKVMMRGVTYGPFKPNNAGLPWPEDAQLRKDIAHIASLGFNTVRVYESPSNLLLDCCREHGLRVIAGVPWTQHVDFFRDGWAAADAIERIGREARRLAAHPEVVGILVGNEIEKTLVRWMGPERVLHFIEKLITEARAHAPETLVGYASYPSTEYLVPRNADFLAVNVFLERPAAFRRHVQHLMNLAAGRPLIVSEFGLDTASHGEAAQAEALLWQEKICRDAGVGGNFWFSYTDEWHRGGEEVTGWDFGLVTRERREKEAASELSLRRPLTVDSLRGAVAKERVSVVVCTRNGSATLASCLQALAKQTHPNYEVLVIDDGSTDTTPEIAKRYAHVRYVRQDHAGLSAARNLGMTEATGTLLAYTDDDCIPDEDWLVYACHAFEDPQVAAAGGPNLPPPPRNLTEACVAVAPGAPAHVLLNDEEAEHLPGCNLVIRKSALHAIGGFRTEFTTAGDDVDVCWRLQSHGGKLRFVPAALVWHHRRFSVSAYLRQQRGYGHAEAMLVRRYPHRFAWLGGARWRGAIYGHDNAPSLRTGALIRFGRFGNALFQTLYANSSASGWDWVMGLPWLVLSMVALAAGVLSTLLLGSMAALIPGLVMPLLTLYAAWRRARLQPPPAQAASPWKSHMLLWMLCLLQPIIRDWGRLKGMVKLHALPSGTTTWPAQHFSQRPSSPQKHWKHEAFWSEDGVGREELLRAMRRMSVEQNLAWQETGDQSSCDAVLVSPQGSRVGLTTVTEYHEEGRRLTRIAYGLPSLWWLDRMLLLVACAGPASHFLNFRHAWLFAVLFLVLACWRAHLSVQARHATRELIYSAAEACGLIKNDAQKEMSPKQLHEGRALAAAGQSGEMYLNKP